ncbi:MAG: methylmalonyl-CoA epimerase [Firmicutes bacterium]|nr:methylmalonyl-CoA epimerase [Bacillota bacterium]
MKVHHIGIAVRNLEEALATYRALGLQAGGQEEVPGQGVRLAFLPAGEARLELLEPLRPDSAVGRFLESRGEGVHHLCLEVDDIEAALERARQAGIRLVDERPREGAHGARVAFLHPRSLHGVLLELWQAPRQGGTAPPHG